MCNERDRQSAALKLCCCVALLLCSYTAALTRHALFRHGALWTSRMQLEQPRRSLAAGSHGGQARLIWAVGLPSRLQGQVWQTLTAHGGKVLHPLPGRHAHHWLVLASEGTITALLTAHEQTTAALLPDDLKVAPQIQAWMTGLPDGDAGEPHDVSLVALVPLASLTDVQQLMEQAVMQLSRVLRPSCALQASPGQHYFRLTVCSQGARHAAQLLAGLPGVTWVDAQPGSHSRSLLAAATTQAADRLSALFKGKSPAMPPPGSLLSSVKSPFFPHWKAGLAGQGEVVGVLDTGADLDSCFLWDPHFRDYANGSSTRRVQLRPYLPPQSVNETLRKFLTPEQKEVTMFANPSHRKVVQYVMWSDSIDGQNPQFTDGHGTHISATIAGNVYGYNPLNKPTIATGVAPFARIAMFDAGSTGEDSNVIVDKSIQENPSLAHELLWQAGARITSTSVGPSDTTYLSPTCYLLDAYAWHKPDTLHVVAAGNAGDQQDQRRTGTVQAPATCKNVLAVGATESWVDVGKRSSMPFNLLDDKGKLVKMTYASYRFPHVNSNKKPGTLVFMDSHGSTIARLDGAAGDFANMEWTGCCYGPTSELDAWAYVKLKLVLPEPLSGCNLTKSFTGPVMVLLKKTAADNADIDPYADPDYSSLYGYADYDSNKATCNAAATIKSLVKHHATAALFYWENESDTQTSAVVAMNTLLPTAVIQKAHVGAQLHALLTKGKAVFAQWLPAARPQSLPPFENVAWYSSYGSAQNTSLGVDSRIKPEIVAPGYVTSAHSDGKYSGSMDKCAVIAKTGTSYATPVVAGAAALVRQYFLYGYYPAGNACSKSKHDPSAPLVKAVLIAGTAAMHGISVIDGKPLAPPPSPYQGFGRLDLLASLPLKKETPNWRMQVVDSAAFDTDGISHDYTLEVLHNPDGRQQPLVAALVWHDAPAFPGARQVLVNDLDLRVEGPAGMQSNRHWGNAQEGGDTLNNVEKVYIAAAAPGTYKISVDASYLFIGARPQPYSLVVLGDIKGTLDSPRNPALQHLKAQKSVRQAKP